MNCQIDQEMKKVACQSVKSWAPFIPSVVKKISFSDVQTMQSRKSNALQLQLKPVDYKIFYNISTYAQEEKRLFASSLMSLVDFDNQNYSGQKNISILINSFGLQVLNSIAALLSFGLIFIYLKNLVLHPIIQVTPEQIKIRGFGQLKPSHWPLSQVKAVNLLYDKKASKALWPDKPYLQNTSKTSSRTICAISLDLKEASSDENKPIVLCPMWMSTQEHQLLTQYLYTTLNHLDDSHKIAFNTL